MTVMPRGSETPRGPWGNYEFDGVYVYQFLTDFYSSLPLDSEVLHKTFDIL
jgi:hypothetical protein